MTREEGDYAEARHYLEQALLIFQEVGSPLNVAITLSNLGYVLRHLGDDALAAHTFREALVLARDLNSKVLTLLALAGLAGPTAAQAGAAGEASGVGAVRAARLVGAATALLEDTGDFLEPVDRADYEANAAAVRMLLSEQAFAEAWAEGYAMTMDEAIAYALESILPAADGLPGDATPETTIRPMALAASTAAGAVSPLQPLTKREIDVLRLVAEGLTTPQIAQRLVLSARTVENHLRSIYGKLDVSTRAAATRLAIEHGLLND
jgi:DNA-binding CsgD family transcriptional regulator